MNLSIIIIMAIAIPVITVMGYYFGYTEGKRKGVEQILKENLIRLGVKGI